MVVVTASAAEAITFKAATSQLKASEHIPRGVQKTTARL
jgi:hypothetical protein